jgi:uncharacterized membrane protein YhaH (DUF805 family)
VLVLRYSGVVQLVARQPLELVILVRVQAPEPSPRQSEAAMIWYFRVLRKYAVFAGRARRKEYWIFGLVHAVIIFALRYPHFLTPMIDPESHLGQIGMLYVFATFIPFVAVSVRRLHDTNRSGWWCLLLLIPLVGFIPTLIFMAEDTQPGENRYGPNPKTDSTSNTAPEMG